MSSNWSLQAAKVNLSELVKKAQMDDPQFISVRGEPAVVIISQKKYNKLVSRSLSIIDFFRQSPLVGIQLDLSRNKS